LPRSSIAAGALLSTLLFVACGDNRGGDVPEIHRAFAAMPNVHVVDVIGWDEMWPIAGPTNIKADLRIGAAGRLVLCDMTLESVAGRSPFILSRVGDSFVNVRAERDLGKPRFVAGCPQSVDVAAGSAFLDLVPFPLRAPSDVISHYAELERLIAGWPDQPTRLCLKDGTCVSYWRSPASE
jgi:hypothetical protein